MLKIDNIYIHIEREREREWERKSSDSLGLGSQNVKIINDFPYIPGKILIFYAGHLWTMGTQDCVIIIFSKNV